MCATAENAEAGVAGAGETEEEGWGEEGLMGVVLLGS